MAGLLRLLRCLKVTEQMAFQSAPNQLHLVRWSHALGTAAPHAAAAAAEPCSPEQRSAAAAAAVIWTGGQGLLPCCSTPRGLGECFGQAAPRPDRAPLLALI